MLRWFWRIRLWFMLVGHHIEVNESIPSKYRFHGRIGPLRAWRTVSMIWEITKPIEKEKNDATEVHE